MKRLRNIDDRKRKFGELDIPNKKLLAIGKNKVSKPPVDKKMRTEIPKRRSKRNKPPGFSNLSPPMHGISDDNVQEGELLPSESVCIFSFSLKKLFSFTHTGAIH